MVVDKCTGRHLAGLIESRKRQHTGTVVNIYRAREQGLDPAGGEYVVVCEDHGAITNFETVKLAREHAPVGGGCEECAAKIWEVA